MEPVFIWPALVATAISAMVESSVSPDLCDTTSEIYEASIWRDQAHQSVIWRRDDAKRLRRAKEDLFKLKESSKTGKAGKNWLFAYILNKVAYEQKLEAELKEYKRCIESSAIQRGLDLLANDKEQIPF
jgi:translation initiation factor 2 beta subunit (eIF-2beta)/eIF-5